MIQLQTKQYESLRNNLLSCELSHKVAFFNQILIYAVKFQSKLSFIKWLLGQDDVIDLNYREPYQKSTAVMWAAKSNLVPYLALLLMHKPYALGLRDQWGFTALHHAVSNNSIQSALLLLRASVPYRNARRVLTVRSHSGHTVSQLADKSPQTPMRTLLTGFKALTCTSYGLKSQTGFDGMQNLSYQKLEDKLDSNQQVIQLLWSSWLNKITPFFWGRTQLQSNLLEIHLIDWLKTERRLHQKDIFLFLFLNPVQCQRYARAKGHILWLLESQARVSPRRCHAF